MTESSPTVGEASASANTEVLALLALIGQMQAERAATREVLTELHGLLQESKAERRRMREMLGNIKSTTEQTMVSMVKDHLDEEYPKFRAALDKALDESGERLNEASREFRRSLLSAARYLDIAKDAPSHAQGRAHATGLLKKMIDAGWGDPLAPRVKEKEK